MAQLVLIAGHIHSPNWHAVHEPAVNLQSALRADHEHRPPSNTLDEHCALCWTQAAAGRITIPPPIVLQLPRLLFADRLQAAFYGITCRAAVHVFRSRAPPLTA
jgi:hypothetical protein